MNGPEEFCPPGVSAVLHGIGQGLRRLYRLNPPANDDAAIALLLGELDQISVDPVSRRS